MKPKFYFHISFFLIILILSGCRKKAEPNWDIDGLAPLAKATLTIEDFFTDSLLETESDQFVKLVYENEFLNFNTDSIFKLPDTTIKESFNPSFTLNAAPGQVFYGNSNETTYNFGKAEIQQIWTQGGEIIINLRSTIEERTRVTLTMPSAEKNGSPLKIVTTIPAATASQKGEASKSIDMTGYVIDMRGPLLNKVNTIYTNIQASIHPDGDSTLIKLSDKLDIEYSFDNVTPSYARGYFGNRHFSSGQASVDFTGLKGLNQGKIDFKEVSVNLKIENFIGADARVHLNQIASFNTVNNESVSLNHSLIGDNIDIGRAVETGGEPPVKEKVFQQEFTQVNSNIDELIENLPDQLNYDFNLELNRLGNVSNGNDFIYYKYPFNTSLNIEIPLELTAENILLTDTTSLNFPSGKKGGVNHGFLTVHAENSFPLDASIELLLLNKEGQIIDEIENQGIIAGAVPGSSGKVNSAVPSEIIIPLSSNDIINLKNSEEVLFKAYFNTVDQPNYIKIYHDYQLKIQVTGEFSYNVQVQ